MGILSGPEALLSYICFILFLILIFLSANCLIQTGFPVLEQFRPVLFPPFKFVLHDSYYTPICILDYITSCFDPGISNFYIFLDIFLYVCVHVKAVKFIFYYFYFLTLTC